MCYNLNNFVLLWVGGIILLNDYFANIEIEPGDSFKRTINGQVINLKNKTNFTVF